MSKTILVMRHAKSSWKDSSIRDHDRPLNDRGLRDAPRMARWMDQQNTVPQIILSSTANRAISTARIVESESSFAGQLLEYGQLYLGQPNDYLQLLAKLDDQLISAMVVGHNHGLEDLVEVLTGNYATMPTAAIAQIELSTNHWADVASTRDAQLVNVWRPKEIDD